MIDYKNGSHTIYDIKYQVVWVTKYRYKILTKVIGERLRVLIHQGCETIVHSQGRLGKIMLTCYLLSCPTNIVPSKIVQYLKGRSSKLLQDEFIEIKKRYWGATFMGSRVFLCNSVAGNGRNNQSIYCKSGQKRYNRNIYN